MHPLGQYKIICPWLKVLMVVRTKWAKTTVFYEFIHATSKPMKRILKRVIGNLVHLICISDQMLLVKIVLRLPTYLT